MLDFIKNLFKKPELEQVQESELKEWISKQLSILKNNTNENINQVKTSIREELKRSHENISKLREASLRNPNISIKEKQYMHGNRQAYITRISQFIDNIEFEDTDYQVLIERCNEFSEKLNLLGKSTMKEYSILQHFFSNEVRDIAINLKTLENLTKQLKSTITRSGYHNILELKNQIDNHFLQKQLKASSKDMIAEINLQLQTLNTKKQEIEAKINALESSDDYRKVKEFENDFQLVSDQIKNHESILINRFSPLSAALKKYERITIDSQSLMQQYMNDPVKALCNDKELKILEILDKLGKQLLSLSLKEAKREKTIAAINDMDETFLRSWINKMNELKAKKENILNLLETNPLGARIESQRKDLVEITEEITKKQMELNAQTKDFNDINLDKSRQNIQEQIKEKLNIEINII